MHILITGGAGFIGANLTQRLLTEGHTVTVIDNLITSSGENIKQCAANPSFSFINHDIVNDFPGEITAIPHIDQIYHLACPTGVPNLVTLAEEMLLTCSIGTKNVLDLARRHNASIVFSGSSEAYGDPLESPQKESYTGNVDPIGIRSPYEEGKRFSESMVVMYVRKYGLKGKIVRIFNTYGPWMSLDDTRVIPRFMTQAVAGKPVTLHGAGNQKRTFCYVDDLVNGLLTVMEKGVPAEVYNLGSDKQITIIDLAEKIIEITHSKSIIQTTDRPGHDHQTRKPLLHKINDLGWKQTYSLETGLEKTLAWLTSVHQSSKV